jgi:hypothetical protein
MREIEMYGGITTRVDDRDYDFLRYWTWTAVTTRYNTYAQTQCRTCQIGLLMHKVITGFSLTDHRDNDGLNNQRENLRQATPKQNSMNKNKPTRWGRFTRGWSRHKGVHPRNGKWRAMIRVDGKLVSLGTFKSEFAAAQAYNDAAGRAFGEFARFNEVSHG